MFINKIILLNWKNFQSVEVNLEERVFIVGSNASGKSNFLDAFKFLRDLAKQAGGLQSAVDDRGGVTKIRCLSARTINDISISIELSDSSSRQLLWRYKIAFKHTGGGITKNAAKIVSEKVENVSTGEVLLDRNEYTENEDSETLKFSHLEQPGFNQGFRDIYFFLRDLQYLHVVPQLMRETESYYLASSKEDFYGRNLLERIAKTNSSTRASYLKKINEVLGLAVPQLSGLEFVKDSNKGTPHLEAKYEHWRPKGARHREQQFSDGTLRLIGFMWALLDGTETILLEEPELYLHAAIVRELPEFISKMQRKKDKKRQVIITTHSYDLLQTDTISPEEILIIEQSSAGSLVKSASQIIEVQTMLEAGFRPADAVLPRVAPRRITSLHQLSLFE